MKLYAILQALLGILVADAPVKLIEHVDKDRMVLVTETHRITVTVEKLPQTIYVGTYTNVTMTNWITWTQPTNSWQPDPRVTAEARPLTP